MKAFRLISLILSILLLVTPLFSCDNGSNITNDTDSESTEETGDSEVSESESTQPPIDSSSENGSENITENTEATSETESEQSTETETEETEAMQTIEDFVSFCDYRVGSLSIGNFAQGKEYGIYFEIPNGRVKSMFLQLATENDSNSNFIISIYRCEQSTEKTVPAFLDETPIFTENVKSLDFKTYLVEFDDVVIGEGNYYMSVTSPDEEQVYNDIVYLGRAWRSSIPDDILQFNFKAFLDGSAQKENAFYGGFVFEHDVPESSIPENNEVAITEKDGNKTAKIIVLSGQSNAVGVAKNSFLQQNVGEEAYQKYVNGFSNVKIIYTNGTDGYVTNISDMFIKTRVGQGYTENYFGPELGLAEYLNTNYPNETFYIVKYAYGGVTIDGYFNTTDPSKASNLIGLKEKIDLAIRTLEDKGLQPKIVAFLWMQGESNATSILNAYKYYDYLKALVENIREEYSAYSSVRGIAFIDAAVSDHGFWTAFMPMNMIKLKYSYESKLNYYIDTNAEGLTTLNENNDQAHYDSLPMIKLGHLFGECISKAID